MGFFTRCGIGLWLTGVVVVGAVVLLGCGSDNINTNPAGGGGGGFQAGGDGSDGTFLSMVMPDGKVWMTKNLNIKTGTSWCYFDGDYYKICVNRLCPD